MTTQIKYSPTQKVNIGVGKDTLNDFARKYNLELEAVYDILNKHNVRRVVFYRTSDYWSQTTSGYKLSLPHNGNVVFAVYKTVSETETTQVLTGVSMNTTNVEVESVDKFDGFILYGALNEEKGIGYNTEDDIVEDITSIKSSMEAEFADLIEKVDEIFNKHSDGVMQFDENFDLMPCQFTFGNELWEVNDDGSLTPTLKDDEDSSSEE